MTGTPPRTAVPGPQPVLPAEPEPLLPARRGPAEDVAAVGAEPDRAPRRPRRPRPSRHGSSATSPPASSPLMRRTRSGREAQPDSTGEQPASRWTVARSAARVGPRLTTTTGMPSRAARATKRRPENTVHEVPATSSTRAASTRRVAALDPLDRHVLAEEDDVRLEHAAAALARGDHEPGGVVEVHVPVRGDVGRAQVVALGPPGVELREPLVQPDPGGERRGSPGTPPATACRAGRPRRGSRRPGAARRRSG